MSSTSSWLVALAVVCRTADQVAVVALGDLERMLADRLLRSQVALHTQSLSGLAALSLHLALHRHCQLSNQQVVGVADAMD
jgi:hypothetical protein